MTIADLGLIEYLSRSGFLRIAIKNGWRPVLGGFIISFRRGLKPFRKYTLRFSIECWDKRWSYMRVEFLSAGKIMATGYAKGAVVSNSGIVESEQTYGALGINTPSPAFSPSVTAWVAAEAALGSQNKERSQKNI
jgi:hypothetical protein